MKFFIRSVIMQLYALDVDGALIFAEVAEKQRDYYCRECRGVIRLRSGFYRRHFYHLQPTHSCVSSGKSMAHLQAQYYLLRQLPPDEGQMECQFPSIGRIADVAWLPRKIIFEIQCSPISADEVRQRNEDYASEGFQVIWILHDTRFNQKRLCAAEDILKMHTHYFTNIDDEGGGGLYDQFSLIYRGMRNHTLDPLFIDIACLKKTPDNKLLTPFTPQMIKMRQQCWAFYCAEDLLDCYLQNKRLEYLQKIYSLEKPIPSGGQKRWHSYIINFYKASIQILLEKSCK